MTQTVGSPGWLGMPPAGELGLTVGRTRFAACGRAPRTGGRRQRCNNGPVAGNVRWRMGSGVRHVPGELFFRRPPPRDERAPRAAAVPVGKRCNSVECRCRLQLRRAKPGRASIRASSVPPSPNSVCHAKERGELSPYASHGYDCSRGFVHDKRGVPEGNLSVYRNNLEDPGPERLNRSSGRHGSSS